MIMVMGILKGKGVLMLRKEETGKILAACQ